jgi:putative ABC transporter, ATP binding/permease protein
VMDAGKIVESGTYTELMAHDSYFARLFASQAG